MAGTTQKYDIDGFNELTTAISTMLNEYPGLAKTETILFSVLGEERGKAWFPVSGAVIEREEKDVLGNVHSTCLYPFIAVYRASGLSERRKLAVKEWLDDLGRWLEGQTVTIGGVEHTLAEYPKLTGNREITEITRTSPAYLDGTEENGAENWCISAQVKYTTHKKSKWRN